MILNYITIEASRGAGAQGVNTTGCGFDPNSRKWNIYLFWGVDFDHSARYVPRIGGKWGTECLNTRFTLPTLRCAGYIVKLLNIAFI